jgi:L-alanine-DL-glutamate epimerase-like enolase superfamily enzyme
MRITAITARAVSVPLSEPFVISLGVIESAEVVLVRVATDAGITGVGEGAGVGFVTGETTGSVLGAVAVFTPGLVGLNPFAIDQAHRVMDALLVGNGSAKAAIDLALYGIMSQAAGQPLWSFLGGSGSVVEADMTIGLGEPSAMAAQASSLVARGFRQIEVKAGADDDQDRAAIALIRGAAPGAHLKVDANQGWTVSHALSMIGHSTGFGVEAGEQPVPGWDVAGLAEVRARSPITIMTVESCFTA